LVEGVGQHAQFVLATLGCPHGVVVLGGDCPGGVRQRENGLRDPSLKRGGQGIGGQHRDREDDDGDDAGKPEGVRYVLRVRRYVESPQPLPSLRHGRRPYQTSALEAVAVRLRRRRDKIGGGGYWIGRQHPPVLVIQRRGNHMRVVLQGCQDFCCVRLVRKRQGGGAVGG